MVHLSAPENKLKHDSSCYIVVTKTSYNISSYWQRQNHTSERNRGNPLQLMLACSVLNSRINVQIIARIYFKNPFF